MTEEEAKKKWCPFARVAIRGVGGNVAANRVYLTNKSKERNAERANCIASKCMAWRWDEAINAPPRPADEPIEDGYCGLAGKPK